MAFSAPNFEVDQRIYDHFSRIDGRNVPTRNRAIPGEGSAYEKPYDIEKAIEIVNNSQNKLKNFIENDAQTILERNEDIKLVLEKFKTIKQRMLEYDNCKLVSINYHGYGSITFYISFVMK